MKGKYLSFSDWMGESYKQLGSGPGELHGASVAPVSVRAWCPFARLGGLAFQIGSVLATIQARDAELSQR